jgi:hypothetical protein
MLTVCPDAGRATLRAELMPRETEVVGAIIFGRGGNVSSSEFDHAVILATFGAMAVHLSPSLGW